MNFSHLPPPPPVGHWERLSQSAARRNLPASLLRSQIAAGSTNVRACRLGARGILHLASADVDRFADTLVAGGAR